MRRRELLLVLGAGMAAARVLRAQQKAIPVVGILNIFSPPTNPGEAARGPIVEGLNQAGFVEGKNVAIERRWAEFHYDRLPALTADLVSHKVDLIITIGGTAPALAAQAATSTIPIIFNGVGDPVGIGLVDSLARPGGNVTGFTNIVTELMPKLLELVAELVPQAKLIALLVNPNNANSEGVIRNTQEAARTKGVQLAVLRAGTKGEIDTAFASLASLQADGLVVDPDSFFSSRRGQLAALASRYAVPAAYPRRPYVAVGGLISYGVDDAALYRQGGIYAGRILKGAKPADLPVQQPTRFELVINLRTAAALGLTVPPSILARADEVIE
jgi:putative ABC transport system substrate-binding protein